MEPIAEEKRVKAEVARVLYPKHVLHLQSIDMWPKEFTPCAPFKSKLYMRHQHEREEVAAAAEAKLERPGLLIKSSLSLKTQVKGGREIILLRNFS